MITRETFFRGTYNNEVFVGTIQVDPRVGATWKVGGVSTPVIKMTDARILPRGIVCDIWNSGLNTITFKDNALGTIGTIAAGGVSRFFFFDNSTQAGIWRLKSKSFL